MLIVIDPYVMSRRDVRHVFYYFARRMETMTEKVNLTIEMPSGSSIEYRYDKKFFIRVSGEPLLNTVDLREQWLLRHHMPIVFNADCEPGEVGHDGIVRRRQRFVVMPREKGRFEVFEKRNYYYWRRKLRGAPAYLRGVCQLVRYQLIYLIQTIERKIDETF